LSDGVETFDHLVCCHGVVAFGGCKLATSAILGMWGVVGRVALV
jgi:hypothetical protein